MSRKRVAFLHTVTTLAPVFKNLVAELAPEIDMYHVVDESLLQNTIRDDELSTITIRRLATYLALAQEAGADAVMVTCSSIGPAAEIGRSLVEIPVLRVDEPMAEKALDHGHRIGVAATVRTTLALGDSPSTLPFVTAILNSEVRGNTEFATPGRRILTGARRSARPVCTRDRESDLVLLTSRSQSGDGFSMASGFYVLFCLTETA